MGDRDKVSSCGTYIVDSQRTCEYQGKCLECGKCILYILNTLPNDTSMIKLGAGLHVNISDEGKPFFFKIGGISEKAAAHLDTLKTHKGKI